MEVDERVVLSRTGQWLFLLKEADKLPDHKHHQQCFGYWFMLDSEAAAMEEEMKRVVNSAQMLQVTAALASLLLHPPPLVFAAAHALSFSIQFCALHLRFIHRTTIVCVRVGLNL